MTFPPEGFPMNTSSFRCGLHSFLFVTILISPISCLAQSGQAPAQRSDYVVSVQELRMAGKGQKNFDKGSHLLLKGDTSASIIYLERSIADYPEHYKAYYDLGVAHFRLGHIAEALQAFQKSIDLTSGKFAPPQFGMAAILCQKQDFAQAERILERGLELEPGSAIGKYYLGWAQFALNHLVDAERNVQQALVRNANLAEVRALLETIHRRQAAVQSIAESGLPAMQP
jgi:tetratricopeptide (TPR) repeat protein